MGPVGRERGLSGSGILGLLIMAGFGDGYFIIICKPNGDIIRGGPQVGRGG